MARAAAANGSPELDRAHRSIAVPVSGTVLLLIDVINDLAFKGSYALVAQAEPMALRLAILKRLKPTSRDYFVLKPKHSGFFDTTLDSCSKRCIRRVIFTGIAGNICVLFTANDAYMRDLTLFAPADCIVSNTTDDNDHALRQIATVVKGDITDSSRLTFHRARHDRVATGPWRQESRQ
jgi:hypothetical protein